uniref:Caerulein 1.1 n=6 Tax=Anura TaxID=8342 RepID=CAE11_LITRO|nr:RecName: Full=Caerulein [Xenopus boumbaensis]C0HKM4.1 RecName: Full=Caerulein [Xenopus ruwenzoriensis]P56264.1 RecName: Full=Caerulein [Litoria xanthomera]P86486.1 RecName: Full=Caerulein [Litoria peronii]P86506.1 RecName: Full=Caerulein 1.1 [Litoria rothii]
QQDYTGWMDF